jgi:hypothetical protein
MRPNLFPRTRCDTKYRFAEPGPYQVQAFAVMPRADAATVAALRSNTSRRTASGTSGRYFSTAPLATPDRAPGRAAPAASTVICDAILPISMSALAAS